MARAFHVSIPNPCRQKWENFVQREQGGFCQSCQKTVIDFSSYSDEELVDYLKKHPGKVCGQLKKEQLKFYQLADNRLHFGKAAAVLASGILMLTQAKEADAKPDSITQVTAIHHESVPEIVPKHVADFVIKGKILDELKDAVPGALIMLKGTKLRAISDKDGDFELRFSSALDDTVTMQISSLGYIMVEQQVPLLAESNSVDNVIMKIDTVLLNEEVIVGGICVEWYRPRVFVHLVKGWFTRKN